MATIDSETGRGAAGMPVTIQCETCGTSVTVGDDMRGLAVPCTHCQRQVVIPDPEAAVDGASGSAIGSSSLSHSGSSSGVVLNSTVFPSEADSIFTNPEVVSEDLFGRAEVLEPSLFAAPGEAALPPQSSVAAPEIAGTPATDTATSAPLTETPAASIASIPPPAPAEPAAEVVPPWLREGTTATDDTAAPRAGAEADAHWALSNEAASPAPEQSWTHEQTVQPLVDEQPSPPRVAPRPKARIPASFWMLSFLLPYALAITVAAVMLFVRTPPRNQHPLESLIDQGVYEEGRQQLIEDPKRELPNDLKPVRLGEARSIGDLEVTPLDVSRQRIKYRYRDGQRDRLSDEEMLVLRLRLKNASHPPVIFHPNDPTFVRGDKDAYTYLEIGKRRFYSPLGNLHTERIEGQNFDELLPEAAMETIVVAAQEISGSPENILAVLKKLSPAEPLLWRVQLRKGQERLEAKGKSKVVWATTVVPIAFTVGDVKEGVVSTSPPADEKKQ
jgi:hypothetical protein